MPSTLQRVPTVVVRLADRLLAGLRGQLVGVYLGGSLSMGDFVPATSDYDLLIVTDGALSPEQLGALARLHGRLLAEAPEASRLEGDYAPRELLIPQGTIGPVPGFRRGVFIPRPAEVMLSADNVANMRRDGIAVYGPPPGDVLPVVAADDVRAAVLAMLRDAPDAVESETEAADELLNVVRSLRALELGEPTTKSRGAEWALERLDSHWHQAIRLALAVRRGEPGPAAGDRRLRRALSEMVSSLGLRAYR